MRTIYILLLVITAQLTQAQKIYTNEAFGISLQIPEGWALGSSESNVKNEPLTDNIRTKLLKEGRSIYLADYYFAPATLTGGLVPKFQINAVYKPQTSYADFKKKFQESTKELYEFLENLKITTPPTETTVSGIKCLYFIMEYTMTVNGVTRSVKTKTYGIPYKDYLFHISLVDGENQDKAVDFNTVIESTKIGF